MWSHENIHDRQLLAKHAALNAVDFIMKNSDLLFHNFDQGDFKGGMLFLQETKEILDEELDKRIEMFKQKAKGE